MSGEAAVRAFVARAFSGWSGLPAECTLTDLRAAGVEVDGEPAVGRLGSPVHQVLFHAAALGDGGGPSRAWVDGDRVVLLDAELPEAIDPRRALVEPLGAPEVRRAARWDVLELPDGEWVWPGAGLAALVGGEGPRVLRLLGFGATTLEDYDRRLRPGSGVREFRAD